MFRKVLSVILAVLFFVNNVSFALSPHPGGADPGTQGQMYAMGRKLLAAKQGAGTGWGDWLWSFYVKHISLSKFKGGAPEIKDLLFRERNEENKPSGSPAGSPYRELLAHKDIIQALDFFRKHMAHIPDHVVTIEKGYFPVNEERGEIPIARWELRGNHWVLVVHTKFVQMWTHIRENDVWFDHEFKDGEFRQSISLAWLLFFCLARHEMKDRGKKGDKEKSSGHFTVNEIGNEAYPYKLEGDSIWTHDVESWANSMDTRFKHLIKAAELWFTTSYAFSDTTRYNNEVLKKRINWLMRSDEGKALGSEEQFPIGDDKADKIKDVPQITWYENLVLAFNYHFFKQRACREKVVSSSGEPVHSEGVWLSRGRIRVPKLTVSQELIDDYNARKKRIDRTINAMGKSEEMGEYFRMMAEKYPRCFRLAAEAVRLFKQEKIDEAVSTTSGAKAIAIDYCSANDPDHLGHKLAMLLAVSEMFQAMNRGGDAEEMSKHAMDLAVAFSSDEAEARGKVRAASENNPELAALRRQIAEIGSEEPAIQEKKIGTFTTVHEAWKFVASLTKRGQVTHMAAVPRDIYDEKPVDEQYCLREDVVNEDVMAVPVDKLATGAEPEYLQRYGEFLGEAPVELYLDMGTVLGNPVCVAKFVPASMKFEDVVARITAMYGLDDPARETLLDQGSAIGRILVEDEKTMADFEADPMPVIGRVSANFLRYAVGRQEVVDRMPPRVSRAVRQADARKKDEIYARNMALERLSGKLHAGKARAGRQNDRVREDALRQIRHDQLWGSKEKEQGPDIAPERLHTYTNVPVKLLLYGSNRVVMGYVTHMSDNERVALMDPAATSDEDLHVVELIRDINLAAFIGDPVTDALLKVSPEDAWLFPGKNVVLNTKTLDRWVVGTIGKDTNSTSISIDYPDDRTELLKADEVAEVWIVPGDEEPAWGSRISIPEKFWKSTAMVTAAQTIMEKVYTLSALIGGGTLITEIPDSTHERLIEELETNWYEDRNLRAIEAEAGKDAKAYIRQLVLEARLTFALISCLLYSGTEDGVTVDDLTDVIKEKVFETLKKGSISREAVDRALDQISQWIASDQIPKLRGTADLSYTWTTAVGRAREEVFPEEEPIIQVISQYVVNIRKFEGPGSMGKPLANEDVENILKSVQQLHSDKIEVLWSQSLGLEDEVSKAIKRINKDRGEGTINIRQFDSPDRLRGFLQSGKKGVKRIIIATPSDGAGITLLAQTSPALLKDVRLLAFNTPDAYRNADSKIKAVHQARIMMIALLARMLEVNREDGPKTLAVEALLKVMLRDFVRLDDVNFDRFIAQLGYHDDGEDIGGVISGRISYFLNNIVNLTEELGRTLRFMREFWTYA